MKPVPPVTTMRIGCLLTHGRAPELYDRTSILGPARMRRALVVEDDPDIVELVAHYLQADGFAVDAAERRQRRRSSGSAPRPTTS